MKVNGIEIVGNKFAYDGCHKIYIIEDKEDERKALSRGYTLLPIEKLEMTYQSSCPLKFIHNWKLNKEYAPQFEDAFFTE